MVAEKIPTLLACCPAGVSKNSHFSRLLQRRLIRQSRKGDLRPSWSQRPSRLHALVLEVKSRQWKASQAKPAMRCQVSPSSKALQSPAAEDRLANALMTAI